MNQEILVKATLQGVSIAFTTFGVAMAAYAGVYVANNILGPLKTRHEI